MPDRWGAINFQINGIGLKIRYSSKSLLRFITGLTARYNFISRVPILRPKAAFSVSASPKLCLKAALKNSRLIVRFRTFDSKAFRYYKKGECFLLTEGVNLLVIRPRQRQAALIIKKRPGQDYAMLINSYFLITIGQLLHYDGFFFLHAAGVVNKTNRILFVSKSGQGKSTSALSLLLQGWKYIADDFVFLRRIGRSRVEAVSLGSEIRIKEGNPILGSRFCCFQKLPHINGRQEIVYQANLASLAPERIMKSFIPNLVLFLDRNGRDTSNIKPVSQTGALLLLMSQSKCLFLPCETVMDNMKLLFDLVKQTKSYILEIGKDISRQKSAVSDLISSLSPQG